ncbi:MAG: hypothetical protein ABEN55_24235 [Bradymonadaceae bacterium]
MLLPVTATAGAPAQVPVQGYLTDSQGVPLDEETTIAVKVFDAKTGGSVLHTEQMTVRPKAGSFTAHLGTNQPLDLAIFRDNDNLWLEVAVEGQTLEPRLRIATAPYAASAGFAQDAAKVGGKSVSQLEQPDWEDIQNKPSDIGGAYSAGDGLTLNNKKFSVDPTQVQQRITGSCSGGKFAVGVNQDGTLMCAAPPTAGAGNGLNKSGTTLSVDTRSIQSRVSDSCGKNEKMIAINKDGTVKCATDDTGGDIDAVKANDGLSGGDSTGSVAISVVSKGVDGAHLSDDLESSDINFSGAGSSRSLEIPIRSVDRTEIAKGAIRNDEIGDGVISSSKLRKGAVTSSEIKDGTIEGKDIGKYPCDQGSSNTEFATVTDCDATFGSVYDLPGCNEVAVGGVCEAMSGDGCANTDNSADHCSNNISEVYVRSTW